MKRFCSTNEATRFVRSLLFLVPLCIAFVSATTFADNDHPTREGGGGAGGGGGNAHPTTTAGPAPSQSIDVTTTARMSIVFLPAQPPPLPSPLPTPVSPPTPSTFNYEYLLCVEGANTDNNGDLASPFTYYYNNCAAPLGFTEMVIPLITAGTTTYAFAHLYQRIHPEGDGFTPKKYTYRQISGGSCAAAAPPGFTPAMIGDGYAYYRYGTGLSALCLYKAGGTAPAKKYTITEIGAAPGHCGPAINCRLRPPSGFPNLVAEHPYYTNGSGNCADFCLWSN